MKLRIAISLAAVALAALGMGIWAPVDKDVPIDTVLPNLERQVKENPKDAQAHYILGRVHSMAYATGKQTVRLIPSKDVNGKPGFPGWSSVRVMLQEDAPMTSERTGHLLRSLAEYKLAIQLDPQNALYLLGHGWMQEMASKFSGTTYVPNYRQTALAAYRKVVELKGKEEREMGAAGLGADALLAREAAQGIVRLLEKSSAKADQKEVAEMQALAKELSNKPFPVTPIVVPLLGETSLPALLDGRRTARFDMVGDGIKRDWPWVKPTTGILVWDPRDTGRITSGRQLFGSNTWWMFFRDGYAALATLDADRDGWLTGPELKGIRVWQDANGNGASDPGEVQPLARWNITGLNANASHRDAAGPRAERGVLFSGGRTAPSFDWIPTPKTVTPTP